MSTPRKLALPQACQKAGIPYLRAWSLITSGACPAERVGRQLFVAPAELAKAAARKSGS